jgi:hypothetical protein
MGFPLTVDGRVEFALLEPESVPSLLGAIELELTTVHASEVVRSGSGVRFRGEVTRMHIGWRVLSAVDVGEIHAGFGRPGVVRYTFSLRTLLLVISGVSLAFGVITSRGSFVRGAVLAAIVWVVAFVGAYTLSAVRLRRWVEGVTWSALGGRPPAPQ